MLPIFIPTIFILLFTGEHRVFYLQERIGYKNRKFKIIKFATMLKNSPNMGTGSLTTKGDPRVLPFGRFLRKSKINELPQVINVLIGNMSIVGARPFMEVDFLKFSEENRKILYKTRPGLTGIGSIVFRDEERITSNVKGDIHEFYKNNIAPYKGLLEHWYQDNLTIYLDFRIILSTIFIVLFSNYKVENIIKNIPSKPENIIFNK